MFTTHEKRVQSSLAGKDSARASGIHYKPQETLT